MTAGGEEITCTPNHPFYSPVKGWTSACKLRAGDVLVTLNGEYVVVEQVQHELLESPETTYNFEVEDYHTYYVGEKSVLVHNRCDLTDAPATTHGDIRIGESGLTQREYDLLKASTNIKHQADGATVCKKFRRIYSMTQYEAFETWLNKYLILDIPPEVKAINFNLYESSGGEDEFDVQLIGAPQYVRDDPDWACNAIFSTGEDLCSIKAVDWEDCLRIVMEYIQKYLSFGTYAKKLKDFLAVTVGFVDGDLEIILEN